MPTALKDSGAEQQKIRGFLGGGENYDKSSEFRAQHSTTSHYRKDWVGWGECVSRIVLLLWPAPQRKMLGLFKKEEASLQNNDKNHY